MTRPRSGWTIPAALLLLALVPVGGGLFRLTDLALFAPTPQTARFHAAPLAVILHVGGATLFMILGALQLVPGLRRHRWHRRAGRVAVPAGLMAALAGLWMTQTFGPGPGNPDLLYGFRITGGLIWVVFLLVAVVAIRAGDILRHRAYMLRALAIGFGAGTSVLTLGLWFGINGALSDQANALCQAAAWGINLTIAETVILRQSRRNAMGVPA